MVASRGVSWLARGIALAIIGLIIGIAVGYAVYPAITPPSVVTTTVGAQTVTVTTTQQVGALPSVITIGAILPLSGDLATFGQNWRAALDLAKNDINDWLRTARPGVTIEFQVEDTATRPAQALDKLQSLYARGIKFVIGPASSGELTNILKYAQDNQIIVISPSSTAVGLAVEKPFIFRFCPNDKFQGVALARAMIQAGIKYLYQVYRQDIYGQGLATATLDRFKQLGGVVLDSVGYPAETKDFSAIVATMNDKIKSAIAQYGADKVGVHLIAFEEGALLFKVATEYPDLRKVKWFGSDGTAGSGEFLKDPAVVQFSIDTKFLNTIFAPTKSVLTDRVRDYVKQVRGVEPDAYTYIVYDIAWVIVKAILEASSVDTVKVEKVIPQVASSFFGASGWILLDATHDRISADYGLWVVLTKGGKTDWYQVGLYSGTTDSVSYTEPGF